jgi:hypothetical protein
VGTGAKKDDSSTARVCASGFHHVTAIYMSYRTANFQALHFKYISTNIGTEYFKHAA